VDGRVKPGHDELADFVLLDQSDLACPASFAKIFPFPPDPNQL
jgi:hypothetical protein